LRKSGELPARRGNNILKKNQRIEEANEQNELQVLENVQFNSRSSIINLSNEIRISYKI